MHTGLLTNGFYRVGQTDFRWVAEWAASHGFKEIEIGDSVELDEALFERIQGEGKIRLGSFCYCKNMLHPLKGKYYTKELLKRIDLAHRLDMDKVIVFTGFDLTPDDEEKNFGGHLPVEKQVDVVAKAYHPIVDYAEKRGVKIAFENCPMMGNIAYSPLIYDQIFEKLDSKNVGFAFDPAHFVWLMNDPYREIIRYGDKIFHVHGKDCEIDRQRLAYTGILATRDWWHYRDPGLGQLNWGKLVACLNEIHYDGVISVEHDDTVWNSTLEKVETGCRIAKETLESAIRTGEMEKGHGSEKGSSSSGASGSVACTCGEIYPPAEG